MNGARRAGEGISHMRWADLRTSLPILFAMLLPALIGCAGGNNRPEAGVAAGVQKVTLTPEQALLVDNGVKQMVASQHAQLSAVTATRHANKPGIHVCGFVSKKQANGKDGANLPFYVELRETGGKTVTERGQMGSDPSRLSKVNFVCRHNN